MIPKFSPLLPCLLLLSACFESDQDCYDRLYQDLRNAERNGERGRSLFEQVKFSAEIAEAKIELMSIHQNEVRSACNFKVVGRKLAVK